SHEVPAPAGRMTGAIVRHARPDDEAAVAALFQAEGWGRPSFDRWWRQTRDNCAGTPDAPFGWVLETGGRAVGFLRNVLQRYRYGDRDLVAAAASTLVVGAEHRGHTLRLVGAFCKQHGVDLLLNTTAAPETAKIFEFLKFSRMPQPEYDLSLYWVLGARGFLTSGLRKKGVPPGLAGAGAVVLAPALSLFLHATGRRASRTAVGDVSVIDVSDIDARFDDLWARRLGEGKRLLAYRDAASLRWHFGFSKTVPPPRVVCAMRDGRLLGYLVLLPQYSEPIDLRRARVADLFVANDDADVIRALLGEASRQAARDGAAMLEVVGLPRQVRAAVRAFRPSTLADRCWPFSYKTADPELRAELPEEQRWYAGLYDGDGSL
ncbi:MAG TPA: hypothetical protein VF424_07005, partial [Vicinamibacterales bacterium]